MENYLTNLKLRLKHLAFENVNNKFLGTNNAVTTTKIVFSSQVDDDDDDDDDNGGSGSQVGQANDYDSFGDFQTTSVQRFFEFLSENPDDFCDRLHFSSFNKS